MIAATMTKASRLKTIGTPKRCGAAVDDLPAILDLAVVKSIVSQCGQPDAEALEEAC